MTTKFDVGDKVYIPGIVKELWTVQDTDGSVSIAYRIEIDDNKSKYDVNCSEEDIIRSN